MPPIDHQVVKRDSEAIILRHGGQICDWLPCLDPRRRPRDVKAIARRALVLNAMLQISLEAPVEIVRKWIADNYLDSDLATSERILLQKNNGQLTRQEQINLYWNLEALWALAWAGGLVDNLPFNQRVGDNLASLCPNLRRNEDGSKLLDRMRLRPHDQLFRMLDLYYRLHWWTRNAELTGRSTGDVSHDIIMERRKALEWVMNADEDWDHVEMGT
jgi:hypothetical protein